MCNLNLLVKCSITEKEFSKNIENWRSYGNFKIGGGMLFRHFKTFFDLFRRVSKITSPEQFLLLKYFFKMIISINIDKWEDLNRKKKSFNFYLEKYEFKKKIWWIFYQNLWKIFKFFQIFSEGAGWLIKKLIFFKMVRYDDLLELVSWWATQPLQRY